MDNNQDILQHELELITGKPMPRNGPSLQQQLARYISDLIVNDQHTLIYLLYRVDLSEKKIKTLLQQQHEDAALLIAELIIERQLQKIALRKQFKQNDQHIPDDEKW